MTTSLRQTTPASRALWITALALAALLTGGRASAQQAARPATQFGSSAPSGNMVIRTTVRRVILDVVVTDSDGNPVPALTRKDFGVVEDGAPQRVLSFDTHQLDTTPAAPLPKPSLPANTFMSLPAEPERGPLYIMLLDLVNTEIEDQMTVRAQVSKFIQSRPAGTRFAVFVLSDQLRMLQGFTSDTGLLYAALDTHHPKPHIPMVFLYGRNSGKKDQGMMLEIFEHIASFVDGLPGRKNIIWVSGAFPLRLFPVRDDGPDYRQEIKRMLDTLARSQVSIYPVDARGVVVEVAYAPGGSASAGGVGSPGGSALADRVSPGGASGGGSTAPASVSGAGVGASQLAADYQTADDIARLTGGHAFYSTNNIEVALNKATERGAAYYELSYSPTNHNYDGSLRNIEVKLAKKGYHLDYRRSYYGAEDSQSPMLFASAPVALPTTAAAGRPLDDALNVEMQYGAPLAHDLLFKAHVRAVGAPVLATPEQMTSLADQPAYFRTRKKDKPAKPLPPIKLQTFAIDYALVAKPVTNAGVNEFGDAAPTFEVAAAVYDADGRMLNGDVENAVQPPDDDENADAPGPVTGAGAFRPYRIQQKIDVPLAATSIRLAVHDLITNRLGTIEIALPLAPEPQTASSAVSSGPS